MKIKTGLISTLFLFPALSYAWFVEEETPATATDPLQEQFQHLFEPVIETPKPEHWVMNENTATTATTPATLPDRPAVLTQATSPTPNTEPKTELKAEAQLNKTPSVTTLDDESAIQYTKAIQLLKRNRHPEAEKTLKQSLKANPSHLLTRVQLAKIKILNEDYVGAELILTEGDNLLSNDPEYLQTLALVYEHQGKASDALTLLQQVPKTYENNLEYVSLLASLYHQTGNYPLAQQHYRHLLTLDPHNERWVLGYSISLDSEGNTAQAMQGYRALLQKGNLDEPVMKFIRERLSLMESAKR